MGATAIIAGSIAGAALLGGGAYDGKKYYNHYKQKKEIEEYRNMLNDFNVRGRKVQMHYQFN